MKASPRESISFSGEPIEVYELIDLSQERIAQMLLTAFLCGIALGLLYEAIRLVRLIISPSCGVGWSRKVLLLIYTFLTDFLFIMFFAATAILLTYKLSGGIFRGIVYLSMSTGLLLYYFTVGKITRTLSERIAEFIKKIIKKILKVLIIPLRAIFLLFFKLYTLTIGKKLCKIICSIMGSVNKR